MRKIKFSTQFFGAGAQSGQGRFCIEPASVQKTGPTLGDPLNKTFSAALRAPGGAPRRKKFCLRGPQGGSRLFFGLWGSNPCRGVTRVPKPIKIPIVASGDAIWELSITFYDPIIAYLQVSLGPNFYFSRNKVC